MKLDRRMSTILSELPQGSNLADIGADHGYIGLSYAKKNANNIVIGSDISEKSIQKAALTAKKLGINNYFTTVGDGITPIKNYDIDVILISGMGGEEIIKILNNQEKYSLYVLSPQKNVDKVRAFLRDNDFEVVKDYKLFDCNKFYDIIVCKQGSYTPSEFELLYGSGVGDDFVAFAKREKQHLTNLLNVVACERDKSKILHKIDLLAKYE